MELLLSVAESAHRLGIGKTRFFELLKAEKLHAVRLGGRTLIPIAELERFVAQLPPRTRSPQPRRRVCARAAWGTAMIKICLVTTTDSLDGQPWPPPSDRNTLWVAVRRAHGCTLWRSINLFKSVRCHGL